MSKFLSKAINPWYPATAIGLEKGVVSVVALDGGGRGEACTLRRAATIDIGKSLIQPSFDEPNIPVSEQLAVALQELTATVGLLRQKRWSVSLPEATTRTFILTLDSHSGSELQDVLKWKMERGFGAGLEDLSISKERLHKDNQGRDRFLVSGIKKSVLAEYEAVFESLGWRTGLVLPRHLGEAQWLVRNGAGGDALLLSASTEGFTAVIFRDKYPLILRTVTCEPEDSVDEFYRLLLFYRDRHTAEGQDSRELLTRLMVVGEGFTKQRATEIVNETMGGDLRALDAEDLGLQLPSSDLSFDAIAAPAGLATLSQ